MKESYGHGGYTVKGIIKNDTQLRKAWERLCEYADMGCFVDTVCVVMAKMEIRAYNKLKEA